MALTKHKCPYCKAAMPQFFVDEVKKRMAVELKDCEPGSAFTWDCPMCNKNFCMSFSDPEHFLVMTTEAYNLVIRRHKTKKHEN